MFSTDWAVKRFFKFVVKRNLGKLLKNEVDLEQLSVQLGSGLVELREVLLNCDAINEKLGGLDLEVTSGYIGLIRVKVPYSSLSTDSCVVEVDEVLLTVSPTGSARADGPTESPGPSGAQDAATGAADDSIAAVLSEGVQMLAGGIEHILQQLQVEVRRATIRVDLPAVTPGNEEAVAVMIRADRVAYKEQQALAGHWERETTKIITLEGLTVDLCGACEGAEESEFNGQLLCGPQGEGVSVTASVRAGVGLAGERLPRDGPAASLEVNIELTPVEVQLRPSQLPAIASLAALGPSADRSSADSAPSAEDTSAHQHPEQDDLSSSQVLDSLVAPGFKGLIADAIMWGWGDSGEDTEVQPGDSRAADMQGGLSESLHQAFPGVPHNESSANALASSMASLLEIAATPPPALKVHLRMAGLATVLSLSDSPPCVAEACPPDGQLVLEVTRLDVSVERDAQGTPGASPPGTRTQVSLWDLEINERLPLEHPDAAGPDGGLEAFGRLPALLPHGPRPSPTFSGLYTPGPTPAGPSGRSTIYASCLAASNMTCMGASSMMASSAMVGSRMAGSVMLDATGLREAAAAHDKCFEVWPVFVCGHPRGSPRAQPGGPCLTVRSSTQSKSGHMGVGKASQSVQADMMPAVMWLRMPLVRHVEDLAATVSASLLANKVSDSQTSPVGDTPRGKDSAAQSPEDEQARQASMVDSMVEDLRQAESTSAEPSNTVSATLLTLQCPHLCLVTLTPRLSLDPEVEFGAARTSVFLALDAFACSGGQPAEKLPLATATFSSEGGCDVGVGIGALEVHVAKQAHEPMQDSASVDVCRLLHTKPNALESCDAEAAVTVEFTWRPSQLSAEWLLHEAWDRVSSRGNAPVGSGEDAPDGVWDNGALEVVKFQDAAVLASAAVLNVRTPALNLAMEHKNTSALALAVAGFNAEAAQRRGSELPEAPEGGLAQVVLLLQCGVRADVFGPEPEASSDSPSIGRGYTGGRQALNRFTSTIGDLQVFHILNLGGVPMAGATVVQAADVSLQALGMVPTCLAWCPQQLPGAQGAPPGLTFFTVTQPSVASSSGAPPQTSAGAPRLQSLAVVDVAGLTVSTHEGDITMPWITDLGRCFALPELQPTALPLPLEVDMAIAVNINDAALRYDPPLDAPEEAAAAVLLLGGVKLGCASGVDSQEISMTSLALYVTEAAKRRGNWAPWARWHLPDTRLTGEQYSLVAQESELNLSIAAAQPEEGASEGEAADPAGWEVAIGNHRLCVCTCPRRLVLLSTLLKQWVPEPTSDVEGICTDEWSNPQRDDPPAMGILGDLVEDAFRTPVGLPRDRQSQLAASVYLAGGWYGEDNGPSASTMFEGPPTVAGAEAAEAAAPHPAWLGDAPDVQDGYMEGTANVPNNMGHHVCNDGIAKGRWYAADTLNLSNAVIENYMPVPRQGPVDCSPLPVGRGGAAVAPLPPGYPKSLGRFTIRNLCGVWRLRTDVDSGSGLDLSFDQLCLAMDTFPESSQQAWRLGVSFADFQIVDSSIRSGSGNPWRRVLGYCASPQQPRDIRKHFISIELEGVRPDPDRSPTIHEARLSCALLPIRLRLDQNVVEFSLSFCAQLESLRPKRIEDQPCVLVQHPDDMPELESTPFFQKVDIEGFAVVIDYRPRHVDVMALREGSLVELANLVPWAGVELNLVPVRLSGCQGWGGLSSDVVAVYLDDIATNQMNKFMAGVAPLHSFYRVGSAAAHLLSLPADRLVREGRFYRTLRRGLGRLVHILMMEALSLGASLAAGAQAVLGGVTLDHAIPVDLQEGLRQAGSRLSGGLEKTATALVVQPLKSISGGSSIAEAVKRAVLATPGAFLAPAAEAAAAIKCTLLGARNTLDSQHDDRA